MKMPNLRRYGVVAVALFAATVLAACGDDGGSASHQSDAGHGNSATTSGATSGTTFNDADARFATDMIAHHRQAIEMAALAPSRSSNAQVKELAEKIQKAQEPEIVTMSGWLRQWGRPVPSMTSSASDAGHSDMPGMDMDMDMGHGGMPGMTSAQDLAQLAASSGTTFDTKFLDLMIKHHQGAVEMAKTVQAQGRDDQVKQLATKIITDQTAELGQMQTMLAGH